MIVVKFGGSSLTGAQRMLAAARIVAGHTRSEPVVCVVSAMAGVTDQLITIANQTLARSSAWREAYADLRARHEEHLRRWPRLLVRNIRPRSPHYGSHSKRTPLRLLPATRGAHRTR